MIQDLLHGLRAARRNPGLTFAAVLLVGLGVGANTAIFAVARTLVFQPLPFGHPERLVSLWRESWQTGTSFGASWPHLTAWKRQDHLFEGVAAYICSGAYASSGGPGSISGTVSELQVTEEFFPLLGVRPTQGRLFLPGEIRPEATGSAAGPVIVSHEFWQRRLLGRSDVLGQVVKIGASARIVIGVLPRHFRVFRDDTPEVFSPLRPFPGHLWDRRMTYLEVIARLRPGVDIERARVEFAAYSQRAGKAHPQTDAGLVGRVDYLHDRLFGSMRPVMAVLLGTVGLVLLIACGNLAVLLLVRAVRRRGEIAIRAALGASRLRIARQIVTESLVLCLTGGAAGLLLSSWATDLFAAFCGSAGIGLPPMMMDGTVVAVAFLISMATAATFGAAPVWHAWKVDLNGSLRAAGPAASERISSHFPGGAVAVVEIALSAVLLIGAGVLLRSFIRLNHVDPGFRAEHVFTMSIGQAPYAAGFRQRDAAFWSQLLERAHALPGVQSAAFSGSLPLVAQHSPENMKARVTLDGRQLPGPGFLAAEYQDVSPGYFRAMGIPIKRGGALEVPAESAAVINESFSRECWGTEDPVGRQLAVPGGRPYTVVGVAGDVRQYNLRGAPTRRQIYRLLSRSDVATLSKWPSQFLVVRTTGDPERIGPLLKDLVRSLDPERPVIQARTMQQLAFQSTAWDQMKVAVVGLFGITALLLTLIGVYAVVSHSVSRRRREIGIRIALGGQPADIRRMILRQGVIVIIAGLAIGIFVALALAPVVSNQLFEVSITDLPTLAGVSVLLVATGVTACWLPVRSAAKTDAVVVLRSE